jgi:hypothetical protein
MPLVTIDLKADRIAYVAKVAESMSDVDEDFASIDEVINVVLMDWQLRREGMEDEPTASASGVQE